MKSFAFLETETTKVPMPDHREPATAMRWIIAIVMLSLSVLVSCRTKPDEAEPKGDTQVLKQDALEISITTSTRKLASSEMFDVTLLVRHDSSYHVQLPEVSEKLGSFYVFDTRSLPDRLDKSGWIELKRIYRCEPDIPGVSDVPEFRVTAKGPDGELVTLVSKPMPVTVTSVLVSGEENFRKIAPDTRPDNAESPSRWPMALLVANVLVVCCLLLVWRKWSKQGSRKENVS